MTANNRIARLLEAYKKRPPEKAEQSLAAFAAERDPHLFAHHPEGPAFREHVWMLGGLYFCKGCVMTFAGMVAGGALFLVYPWLRHVTDAQAGLAFTALLAPSVLTALLEPPRPFRHAARFLLGVLMVSAFLFLFVTDSWLVRAVIVAVYFGARIPLEKKRNRLNRDLSSGERR